MTGYRQREFILDAGHSPQYQLDLVQRQQTFGSQFYFAVRIDKKAGRNGSYSVEWGWDLLCRSGKNGIIYFFI